MAAREIRLLGDPVLRGKAEAVPGVDEDVRRLITDMFETMRAADGVGLAAPQLGISSRIIVVAPHERDVRPFALINPEIDELGEELARGEEGCLSIPGLQEIVERPSHVVVRGLDQDGQPRRIDADGLLARVLQHEIDHLDGILFIDRVSPLKRQMLLKRWKKMGPA